MYQELHSISQAIATCSCYCSVGKSYPTLCDPTDCTMPGLPVSHYLPEFAQTMFIESVMPSNHLILHPSLLLLPSTFPASGSFPMSQLFASGDQSIGASVSASVLPTNIQEWFPLGLTGLISLLSKGLSSLLQHHSSIASILWHSAFFMGQLSHPYVTIGKNVSLTIQTSVGKVMSLLFNTLPRFVIAFLSRNKHPCTYVLGTVLKTHVVIKFSPQCCIRYS